MVCVNVKDENFIAISKRLDIAPKILEGIIDGYWGVNPELAQKQEFPSDQYILKSLKLGGVSSTQFSSLLEYENAHALWERDYSNVRTFNNYFDARAYRYLASQLFGDNNVGVHPRLDKTFDVVVLEPQKNIPSERIITKPETTESTEVKEGVSELFESNPELANSVYEALGFKNKLKTTLGKELEYKDPYVPQSRLKSFKQYEVLNESGDNIGTVVVEYRGNETVILHPKLNVTSKGYGKDLYKLISSKFNVEVQEWNEGAIANSDSAKKMWDSLEKEGSAKRIIDAEQGDNFRVLNYSNQLTPQQKQQQKADIKRINEERDKELKTAGKKQVEKHLKGIRQSLNEDLEPTQEEVDAEINPYARSIEEGKESAEEEATFQKIKKSGVLAITNSLEALKRTLEQNPTLATKEILEEIKQLEDKLKKLGIEIPDIKGIEYKEGMTLIATFKDSSNENSTTDRKVITSVQKPQVNYKGKMVQAAEVTVTINYDSEVDSKTSADKINAKYDAELAELNNQITPEQKQQAQQLYSKYLDAIFPDSKVKDIVYHGADEKIEKFTLDKKKNKKEKGLFFFSKKSSAQLWRDASFEEDNTQQGDLIYALLNIKNPEIIDFENKSAWDMAKYANENIKGDGLIAINVDEMYVGRDTQYAAFKPEQIHILGSKQDIENFANFVAYENSDFSKIGNINQFKDYIMSKNFAAVEEFLVANNKIDRKC